MTIAMATQETTNQAVARPLKVLVQLIKQDIEKAAEVANEAASPYYQSIGEKLIEAKSNKERKGSWVYYVKQQFNISQVAAWYWMDYAEQAKIITHGYDFTFAEYRRLKRKPPKVETKSETKTGAETNTSSTDGAAGNKGLSDDARRAAAKLEEEQTRKMALKIIDTGYKVLSKRLHPDVGGDAMDFNRLKTATTQLKELI
jgi:hypothetical protein